MIKPLVYLIDDDLELTKIIERRFLVFGCDVLTFSNPTPLLEAIANKIPNLLLVDLNLGDGFSGFDIIKKLKGENKVNFPIIVLSGELDQKQIAHALEIGANDYIAKPPLRPDFEEIISQFIKAENLTESNPEPFHPVSINKNSLKLLFKLSIEEVSPGGFVLLSDHLINKSASFHLSGPELKQITPACEKILVRVIGSATKIVGARKKYEIKVEIDESQDQALIGVREFLDARFAIKP